MGALSLSWWTLARWWTLNNKVHQQGPPRESCSAAESCNILVDLVDLIPTPHTYVRTRTHTHAHAHARRRAIQVHHVHQIA